jgi:hypothetical protein
MLIDCPSSRSTASAVDIAVASIAAATEDAELSDVTDIEEEDEGANFDDEEDAKVMEEAKIKALKRKGIKVISKEKAERTREKNAMKRKRIAEEE